MHWHPPHRLLDPLIQAQLTERVLLRGILFRRFTRRLDLVDTDCDAERRICFLPDLRVRPVVRFLRAVDHRIECRVDLPSFKNVLGFLVGLVTDRFRVCPGSGDEEVQRLHARVAGAFCHDVEQLPVRLCVQLIEHHAVDVEAVLGIRLRGQHLIKAVGRQIDHALHGGVDLHALCQSRAHPHHVGGYLKYDRSLLSVRRTAVYLRTFLAIPAGQEQCHRRRKFGIVRRQKRTAHQILMRRGIHLYALHTAVCNRFNGIDVPEMAACCRVPLHSIPCFPLQSRDGHIGKCCELHVVQRLPGSLSSALTALLRPVDPLCGVCLCDGVLDSQAPEKLAHTFRKSFLRGGVYRLPLPVADRTIGIHQPLQ